MEYAGVYNWRHQEPLFHREPPSLSIKPFKFLGSVDGKIFLSSLYLAMGHLGVCAYLDLYITIPVLLVYVIFPDENGLRRIY